MFTLANKAQVVSVLASQPTKAVLHFFFISLHTWYIMCTLGSVLLNMKLFSVGIVQEKLCLAWRLNKRKLHNNYTVLATRRHSN